jgi:hypothetical protein
MKTFLAAVLAGAIAFMPQTSPAQETMRSEMVRFAAGTTGTTIRDRITGRDTVLYKIGAQAGQTMNVSLRSANTSIYFNVYAPGSGPGGEALAVGSQTGPTMFELNRFSALLPQSGEYTVLVYLFRNAARRWESADYSLDLSITGAASTGGQNDYADGLQGGPDYWQVRMSNPTGVLNVRSAPSTGAPAIGRFPNTAILRNLGCRMNEGRRWCRVEATAPGGIPGWVAGNFLVESAAPGSSANTGATSSTSEPQTLSERVRFPAGQFGTVLSRTLRPGEAINYILGARNGQFLDVQFLTGGRGLHFNVFVPNGGTLYQSQATNNMPYRGQLYLTGDHTVTVYNTGNTPARFDLEVGVQ